MLTIIYTVIFIPFNLLHKITKQQGGIYMSEKIIKHYEGLICPICSGKLDL